MADSPIPQAVVTPFMGFLEFIRERGVMGLAVGFIMGGAVTQTVKSFVDDVLNPIVGMVAGQNLNLTEMSIGIVNVGSFANNLINLIIISAVVYFILYKGLRLHILEKPKQ